MNNYDLLKLLGKIDRKYYDEAIGSDPQKPLRIDVSRKPIKWYQIAAPIAACLLLGVGIIAAPRVIDHIGTTESYPDVVISEPTVSTSDPTISNDPTAEPELTEFYEHYPIADLNYIPESTEGNDTAPNVTLSVTKYGEFDICLTGDGVYRIPDSDYIRSEKLSICLVKGSECYSHVDFEQDFTLYAGYIPQADIFELSGHTVGACVKFFSINDYKLSLLKGKIDKKVLSEELEQQEDYLIDRQNGYKYVFDFDSFDDPSWEGNNFMTYYPKIEEDPTINFTNYYPYLYEEDLPVFDGDPTDEQMKLAVKRAMIDEFTVDKNGTSDDYRYTKAALVAENLYTTPIDKKNHAARGENLAIVMYKDNKLLKKIDLAPDYEQTIVYDMAGYPSYVDQYTISGCTVMFFNRSCFAAVTENGELTLLKGLMPDGTISAKVSYIPQHKFFSQTENSLIDIYGGYEYRFFPENFKYTDPTPQQAHFTVSDDISEFNSKYTNGHVYNNTEENIPMPDVSGYNKVLGTQADLDRWNAFIASCWDSYINSEDPPIITCVSKSESRQLSTGKEVYTIFSDIRSSEFGLLEKFPTPDEPEPYDPTVPAPTGNSGFGTEGRRAPEVFAFDSDGNMLFSVYIPNEEYVLVTFNGSSESYLFSSEGTNVNFIIDRLESYY